MDCPKSKVLRKLGWVEVPGTTEWRAPVTLTGKAHYLSLEAAYELETEGPGIYEYSSFELLADLRREEDAFRQEIKDEDEFSRTGIRKGVFPNY